MKIGQKRSALTMVELIVVITILTILGSIGFVSFSKYNSSARDTARMSDIENIENVLNLSYSVKGKFPYPSNATEIVHSGSLLWTQGDFGKETQGELGKIVGDLQDPKYKVPYTYSVTQTQREYQIGAVFERTDVSSDNILAYTIPELNLINKAHASYYDPSVLNPKIWLDGEDIDGDGDLNDNPADGSAITTWVNKGTIGAAGNPTITHGTVTYSDSLNGYRAPFIEKDDGMRFENSDITQGEIYYVLHDSGGKVSGMALQGTVKKYTIGAYSNYRNALRINSAPNHITKAPAIKNSLRRKAFFYSFVTDDENYEFRNTGNLISQGATNSITGITWAINKAGGDSSTNRLADWGIGEVLIFDVELEVENRHKVEGYLAHKWGIDDKLPATHPYKVTPPTTAVTPPPEPEPTPPKTGVYIQGNYNKLFVHSENSDTHYVISTPSIVTSDLSNTNIEDIMTNNSLSYNQYGNIPATYSGTNLEFEGGFNFYTSTPILFEGSRDELVSYNSIKDIDAGVLTAYSGFVEYGDISYALEDNSMQYVERILGDVVGINPIKPFYCRDILESGLTRNIAPFTSVVDGLSTELEMLTNGTKGVDDGYTATRENETLIMEFETPMTVGYVRIFNDLANPENLSGAEVRLFDTDDTIMYSHTLWDTESDFIIDLDLEGIGELHTAKSVEIQALNGNIMQLREVELYPEGNIKNGFYKVDDDGIGGKGSYEVYCDMETDGGGWTQLGSDLIENGKMTDGQHVLNHSLNNPGKNNIISKSNPSDSTYVLEQKNFISVSDSTIDYELLFSNLNGMEEGTELRLSAWVAYDGDVSSINIFDYDLTYIDSTTATDVILETVDSLLVDGVNWERKSLRIPIEKEVIDFKWNLGKGIPKTSSQKLFVSDMKAELFLK